MTTTAKTTTMICDPHQRRHLVDRRGENPGEAREADAQPVGQSEHARHVYPERLDESGVLDRGAQIRTELRSFDQNPDGQAEGNRDNDDPAAISRQEHEAEFEAAAQRGRRRVGFARAAV